MKKIIFPIVLVVLVCLLVFDKCSYSNLSNNFKHTQDSLIRAVDSMKLSLAKDSVYIDSLNKKNIVLEAEILHNETKIKYIIKYVDSSKKIIETLSDSALVSTFNVRYPKDTTNHKLQVARPVLVSAAQDLIELDGTKKQLQIKDTIISLFQKEVATKDTIIGVYTKKETTYKNIVFTKDVQLSSWKYQYDLLELENKKLQKRTKLSRVLPYIIAGGLVYVIIK